MAAEQLDEPVEGLAIEAGAIFVAGEPQRRLPYERVARGGHYQPGGRTLMAEAFYDPPTTMLDKDLHGNVSASYAFAAQAVVLDVEEATGSDPGAPRRLRHDVGRALNPLAAEGQIHGGIHMGLATPWPSVSRRERAGCSPRRSWTTPSCERTTCPSWWCASSSHTRPEGPFAPRASASPA